MAFYNDISAYYDIIFPTGNEQIEFISKTAGIPPLLLMDVACGTGGYSIELAKLGYRLTAVDMDNSMVNIIKRKSIEQKLDIKCITASMTELNDIKGNNYDTIFCIGNSLVHLEGINEIESFFYSVNKLLNEGGTFIFQIINFDRVLKYNIKSLTEIKDEGIGLRFERYYNYNSEINKVLFKTVLTVDGKVIENEIPLYPLVMDEAVKMLNNAGFSDIELFGDFKNSSYDRYNSYMLVVRTKK